MIKTKITELFGLRYPIIQAGMVWTSGWRLAAAVAEAGALGLIGAGSMTPDLLREHIHKIKKAVTKGVWGVNLPIFFEYADDMEKVIREEEVRIVFTSGGSPKKYTKRFKDAGMKVVHVTSTPELASKCEDAGVDAVVVEGFEAGGHNGRDELTTLVLVPQARDAAKIPVIAAGGIYDGRGVAAVLAMGAEGAQIGTRFAATVESSCHPKFKEAMINASTTDTFLVLKKLIPARVIKNEWFQRIADAEAQGATPEQLLQLIGEKRTKRGMFDGDLAEGELQIGQIAGAIHELKTAGDLVHEIGRECEETLKRLYARIVS